MRFCECISSLHSFPTHFAHCSAAILLILTFTGNCLVAAEDQVDRNTKSEQLWFGTLESGGARLRLLVKLTPFDDGYRGQLVSLDQGAAEIPIDRIVLDSRRLNLSVETIKGDFDGRLNAGRTEAKGTWTQRGRKMRLVLRRIEKDPEPAAQGADRKLPSNANVPLEELVRKLRTEKKLAGLAATVMVNGIIVDAAVDGERKLGSGVALKIGDRFHIGSVTKSITATMIARLVESGRMHWSDTVGECFSDAEIHDGWKPVTLRQLLTHTSGAPPNFPETVALSRPAPGRECTQARRAAVLNVLASEPVSRPGEKFAYSNVGYTIAGAMAEKATGWSWEDLVTRGVFQPLKLSSGGFGPPKSSDATLQQPRGHKAILGRKVAVNDEADNTPIIGPAGIVHMTLHDLCTYAMEHLRGDLGKGKLLTADSYKRLHTPELDNYACGWVRKAQGENIPHVLFWHNGSNTMWYALVVFIPEKNMVVAVTSNDGDITSAEAAAWDIVQSNVQRFNADATR